jgi:restriction system protein
MKEIMKLTPTDFEKLVVKLLLKMGYGEGIENAGNVTSQTNDGGIDGMIKEDKLGFSYIYIQAKQWATDRTVDRPEIHKFIGSLNERKATKGLFITTAKFSAGAKEAARNCMGSKVVLVDGLQLTKLMIQYNLGVAVETVYEVKRLTSDFGLDDF